MDDNQLELSLRDLTAGIVSAYVTNNVFRGADLPELIVSVYAALEGLGQSDPVAIDDPLVKPVSVRKSLHPDYLISMEDGKRYQSLKRHLTGRGLTPESYRTKWGLPGDYPMVSSNYSERRSALAKPFGLGRKRQDPAPAAAAPVKAKPAAKRARRTVTAE